MKKFIKRKEEIIEKINKLNPNNFSFNPDKEYSERDLNGARINNTFPNSWSLGKIIRRDKPNSELTKKYPNDQELGREFRKLKIKQFESSKFQVFANVIL